MTNGISKKSIRFRFRMTIIIILIIMTIIFIYSNRMKDKIIDDYNRYMDINVKLSNLSLEFNKRWSYFNSYYQEKSREVRDAYVKSNVRIKELMDYVEPYVKQDKDSSIFFRNLIGMNEWFQNNSYLVIVRDESTRSYNDYTNLRTMNNYISKHANSLMGSYLRHTESKYSNILAEYKTVDTNIYMLLTLTIFISMMIFKLVSDDIVTKLRTLSEYANKLSNAEWDTSDIVEESYKELDEFTHTLNTMKNSIKEYINKLNEAAKIESDLQKEKIKNIEKDKIIKETQMKALQMQINPHFLFNNLNTVSRMAMFEGATNTVEIVDAVSKVLRFNLSQRDNFIQLRDELDIIEALDYIHRIKFEDRFRINYNIDKDLYSIKIPPMIIQLLVENAIKHGFTGTNKEGEIDIKIFREKEFVVIEVEDNGRGICKEKLASIKRGEDIKKNKYSTGLGLMNVRKRLELYFDRSDLLSIDSMEGLGTKVRIFIPVERG